MSDWIDIETSAEIRGHAKRTLFKKEDILTIRLFEFSGGPHTAIFLKEKCRSEDGAESHTKIEIKADCYEQLKKVLAPDADEVKVK